MSYKDEYSNRKSYGNESEEVFKKFCRDQKIDYTNFGVEPYLEVKDITYKHPEYYGMDNRLKKQPDYIIKWKEEFKFIECKASGVDENMEYVLRLKEQDINGYAYWNIFNPVIIFISYNFNKSYILISLHTIIAEMKKVDQQIYENNNQKYRTLYINQLLKHNL